MRRRCESEGLERLEHEDLRRCARRPLGESSDERECLTLFSLSTTNVVRAANLSAKDFKISDDQAGPTRGAAVMISFIVLHVRATWRVQRLGVLLRSFVMDRLRTAGSHGRVCVVECAIARLRWCGEDLGLEVVFWIDAWSV